MKYKIQGGDKLSGNIKIGGAKNASLPLLAALLINDGKVIVKNISAIADVRHKIDILKTIGGKINFLEYDVVEIDLSGVDNNQIENGLGIRTTILLIGGLLSKFPYCKVPLPQGDKIGERKFDMHIDCLGQMGIKIEEKDNYLVCTRQETIKPIQYKFRQKSVGATENAIICACIADGTTILENCAKEVEIEFMCNVLNMLGANINGIGTSTLYIKGNGSRLKNKDTVTINVIPDRVQAVTYLLLPMFTQGKVTVTHEAIHDVLHGAPLHLLAQMGAKVVLEKNSITCQYKKQDPINYCMVQTGPYPGFNTDSHPMFLAAMSLNVKNGIVYENVYENRFQYANELSKLGANLIYNNRIIKSSYIDQYVGCDLFANDIRSGSTLVLSALNSTQVSTIDNIRQIHRGYENLEKNLQDLGANIQLVE